MMKHNGLALLLVLWVLSLLTIMAGSFVLSIRRETALITGLKNNATAMATAESGLALAEWMLLNPDQNKRWRTDGSIYQIDADNATLRIRLLSETGKININSAEFSVLQNLLSHAPTGVNAQLPLTTINRAAALIDWRDSDDFVQINGAEKQQYREAGLNYQPRNQNFQTLDELQMVLGMDAATLQWLAPFITVYSPQLEVNLPLASKEVLQLLFGDKTELIANYVTARINSAKNDLPPPALPLTLPVESSETSILTVISEVRLHDQSTAVINVIIKKSQTVQSAPFQVLRWQGNTINGVSLFADNMNELVVKHYAESEFNH